MSRGRNASTVGRRSPKKPVELIGVLTSIAAVLDAPRDRLGRLDICHGTPESEAREHIQHLAIAFGVSGFDPKGKNDLLEQCAKVAKAAVERAQR